MHDRQSRGYAEPFHSREVQNLHHGYHHRIPIRLEELRLICYRWRRTISSCKKQMTLANELSIPINEEI
jgi:hypothetical protein